MSNTPPTIPFPFDNMFMSYNYYTGFTQAGFDTSDLRILKSGSTVYWYGNDLEPTGNNQKIFHYSAIDWLNKNGYTCSPIFDKTISKYKTTFNGQTITGDTYNDICNLIYSRAIQLTPF